MLYHIVLVSVIHLHRSVIGKHISPPSWTSLPPYPTPVGCHRAPDLSSTHHTANSHWLVDLCSVSAGKESTCNAGDLGSIPGLGRFPWRNERLPTPVFWPGEFHGLYSPWGHKELDTTERPSLVILPGESHGQRSLAGYVRGVAKSRRWLKWLTLSLHNVYVIFLVQQLVRVTFIP